MNVSDIFEPMDYGPAPESSAEALAWLVDWLAAAGYEFKTVGEVAAAVQEAAGHV